MKRLALVLVVVGASLLGLRDASAQTCPKSAVDLPSCVPLPTAACTGGPAACPPFIQDVDNDGYAPATGVTVNHPPITTGMNCYVGGGGTPAYYIAATCSSGVNSPDCDDGAPGTNPDPATIEVVGNDVDENCDSVATCFEDLDADTYGSSTVSTTTVAAANGATAVAACAAPLSFIAAVAGDCLDVAGAGAGVNPDPATVEVPGNDVDENCNGAATCYEDLDGDTYGSSTVSTTTVAAANGATAVAACAAPLSFIAAVAGDCLDVSLLTNVYSDDVRPGVPEVCDGYDTDCTGGATFADAGGDELDFDVDGYVECTLLGPAQAAIGELGPILSGASALLGDSDCSDAFPTIHPGQIDDYGTSALTQLVDNDCDSIIDDDSINAGAITIEEVSVQPVSANNQEWFEIVNNGGFPIRLDNWTISANDFATDVTTVPAGVLVPAASRVLVCAAPGAPPILPAGVTCLVNMGALVGSLDDTSDSIALAYLDGGAISPTEVDCVAWGSAGTVGCPQSFPTVAAGKSASLGGGSWCQGLTDIFGANTDDGTPGLVNTSCSPSAQDLDGDGYCPVGRDVNGNGDCSGAGETNPLDGDCDETLPLVNTGQAEICDGYDTNCSNNDGDSAPSAAEEPGEIDDDGDGYVECGNMMTVVAGATGGGDCADSVAQLDVDYAAVFGSAYSSAHANAAGVLASINPTGAAACDGWINDCSGPTAPNYIPTTGTSAGEFDDDGDGFVECADPGATGGVVGWVNTLAQADLRLTGANDCADVALDAASGFPNAGGLTSAQLFRINPGAAEICDGFADDCLGPITAYLPLPGVETDDDVGGADGYVECGVDAFGVELGALGPFVDNGFGLSGGADCDDTDATRNPGVVDTFAGNPGADNDCDLLVDEDDLLAGELLITEVDAQVAGGVDDWIEIYNSSSRPLDLAQWVVSDNSTATDTFNVLAGAMVVQPGAYAVLCMGSAPLGAVCLNSTPIALTLDVADSFEIDVSFVGAAVGPLRVNEVAWGGAGVALQTGGSSQFESALVRSTTTAIQNNDPTNWCPSYTPSTGILGTPDAENTTCDLTKQDNDLDGWCEFGQDTNSDGDCADAGEARPLGSQDCLDDPTNSYSGSVNPGVVEVCDGYDTDCSSSGGGGIAGGTLTAASPTPDVAAERDDDDDGAIECTGLVVTTTALNGTGLLLDSGGDCFDTADAYAGSVRPGVGEACDGYDTDCSAATGSLSPSAPGADDITELDDDGDGGIECAGFVATTTALNPAGLLITLGGDCLDEDLGTNSYSASVLPGLDDTCDGYDTDCSAANAAVPPVQISAALPAPDAPDEVDDDNDQYVECAHFVAGTTALNTETPAGEVLLGGADCVDFPLAANPYSGDIRPWAAERCDGYDNNCDQIASFTDMLGGELDEDGDGWLACDSGVATSPTPIGTTPPGWTVPLFGGGDCADNPALGGASRFPGNNEVCDGVDNDCNELTGFPPNVTPNLDVDLDSDGVLVCGGDCNDDPDAGGASVQPGAAELCDGLDNNCDGLPLPAGEDDEDGDGQKPCDSDCNDNDAAQFNGATDADSEGRDIDCDGWIRVEQLDCDGDGQRPAPTEAVVGCAGVPTKTILCFEQELAAECRSPDGDGDGVGDALDTCPQTVNRVQTDTDGDGLGDACDLDDDSDGILDLDDNCPIAANFDQDARACDGLLNNYVVPGDADADGVADVDGSGQPLDNCILTPNQDQSDVGGDQRGDLCDPDDDDDGVDDPDDNCPLLGNPDQLDTDLDGLGDLCDPEPTLPSERDEYWMVDLRPFNVDTLSEVTEGVYFVRHARHVPLRPEGCAASGTDCDDGCARRCEGAPEVCDGIDNDCDPFVLGDRLSPDDSNETGLDGASMARDGIPDVLQGVSAAPGLVPAQESDVDGDGVPACRVGQLLPSDQIYTSTRVCEDGYSADLLVAEDCNDSCALSFPEAVEVCDGALNNCGVVLGSEEKDGDRDDHTACGPGTESELDVEFAYLLVFELRGVEIPLAPPAPAGLACGACAGVSWREPRANEAQVPLVSDVCGLLTPDGPPDADAMESADGWRCGLTESEFDDAVVGLCRAFPESCRAVELRLLPDADEGMRSMLGGDELVARLCAADDPRSMDCPETFDSPLACDWTGPVDPDELAAPPDWGGDDARPASDVPTCALSLGARTLWPGYRLSEARRVLTVWQGCSEEAGSPLSRLPTVPGALESLCSVPADAPFERDIVVLGEDRIRPEVGLSDRAPVVLRPGAPFELQAFLPTQLPVEHSLHGCWSTGAENSEAAPSADFRNDVGGDCAEDEESVHRDHVEGPSDVLSYVLLHSRGLLPPSVVADQTELLDCRFCMDGLDNDCDGLADSEDPSCDLCSRDGCTGCTAAISPIPRGAAAALLLVTLLMGALVRRPTRIREVRRGR